MRSRANRQKIGPRDPAKTAVCAGAFAVFVHIVGPDTVAVDDHRHRIGAVVTDTARCGMVGADDDKGVP